MTTIKSSLFEEVAKLPFEESDIVLNRFYKHVKERPNDVYLIQPMTMTEGQQQDDEHITTTTCYTFQQVYDEAFTMANYINSLNLPKQSKIAIISKNCAHFFITELAIWMSGNVTVALFPNLSSSTCKYIFEHSESKILFLGKIDDDDWNTMKDGVPADIPIIEMGPLALPTKNVVDGRCVTTWDSIKEKTKKHLLEEDGGDDEDDESALYYYPKRSPDDESLIVYTSGSTGTPKGVLHTFQTISYPSKLMSRFHNYDRNDRYLSYVPLAHVVDRCLGECFSMYNGFRVYFAETLPQTFVDDLKRSRPTLFFSFPRLWSKFQSGVYRKTENPKKLNFMLKVPILRKIVAKKVLKSLGLDCVRFAIAGSAPMPDDIIQWYRTLGLTLLEGYGTTENFGYSHMTIIGNEQTGYVGSAQPGVECKLSDDEDGISEILVKGPGNMVGYYKEPDKTKEVMTDDGFFRTGDRGIIDDQNRLKIIGRINELFKTSASKGNNKYVAAAPIEKILNNNPNIEMSLVCGSERHVTTMAIVQLSEEGLHSKCQTDTDAKKKVESDMAGLIQVVNSQIEEYEKVGFIVIAKEPWTIEDGLLTPTMKIKRTQINEKYEQYMDDWYEKAASSKTADVLFWE